MKVARTLEVLIGIVFIYTAATKAIDLLGFAIQVRGYGVVPADLTVELWIARITTAVEAGLGAALIAGIRLKGLVLVFTAAMLVGFTALIAYGWAFKGLEDCGCFGTSIQMGPGPSIAKNIVILIMTGIAWYGLRGAAGAAVSPAFRSASYIGAGAALIAVVVAGVIGNAGSEPPVIPDGVTAEDIKERRFAQFVFTTDDGETVDLGKGQYLVAILNADCEHCQAAVGVLNELVNTPDFPPVVGLVLYEDPDKKEEFQILANPQFPTNEITQTTLFEFSVGSSPPSFYYVEDGIDLRSSGELDPTVETFLDLVEGE